jgi:hypothetical protein
MDPFTAQFPRAKRGDFIKDMSPAKRSLGLVMLVDEKTCMMQVKFPKIGESNWVMWKNHGHYVVV